VGKFLLSKERKALCHKRVPLEINGVIDGKGPIRKEACPKHDEKIDLPGDMGVSTGKKKKKLIGRPKPWSILYQQGGGGG